MLSLVDGTPPFEVNLTTNLAHRVPVKSWVVSVGLVRIDVTSGYELAQSLVLDALEDLVVKGVKRLLRCCVNLLPVLLLVSDLTEEELLCCLPLQLEVPNLLLDAAAQARVGQIALLGFADYTGRSSWDSRCSIAALSASIIGANICP